MKVFAPQSANVRFWRTGGIQAVCTRDGFPPMRKFKLGHYPIQGSSVTPQTLY
jgi:hypothetical protein